MKRIIVFLLVMSLVLNINVKSIYADQVVHSDIDLIVEEITSEDIDTLFLPVAIPVSQAIVYMMGVLGVVGVGSAIYANADALMEFGNKQIEKFKVKALALGLTAEIVDNWLTDLGNGVLKKSSEVWTAFKTWVSSLRDTVNTPSIEFPYDGKVYANQEINLMSLLTSGSTLDYDGHTLTNAHIEIPNDGYFYVSNRASMTNNYGFYYATTKTGTVKLYTSIFGVGDKTYSIQLTDSYSTVINGTKYYYRLIGGYLEGNGWDCVISSKVPYLAKPSPNSISPSTALNMIINGVYTPSESEYTIVGGITDINGVNVSNPGVTSDDVVINWDNVGSIPGVIGGVVGGTISWDDALTAGGVIVKENDVTIGGSEDVVDKPDTPVIEWPEVDVGNIGDYTLDLTNIFPFCLPFDFIDFLNILSAEPETPYFEYDMPLPGGINGGSYKFVIDLSPFDNAAALMRKMETLAFIIGLVFITREKMIRG